MCISLKPGQTNLNYFYIFALSKHFGIAHLTEKNNIRHVWYFLGYEVIYIVSTYCTNFHKLQIYNEKNMARLK